MAAVQTKARRFVKTVDPEEFMANMVGSPRLTEFFEAWNSLPLRKKCISEMWRSDRSFVPDEWLEACITELWAQHDPLVESLLELYLFRKDNDGGFPDWQHTERTLTFLINLQDKEGGSCDEYQLVARKLLGKKLSGAIGSYRHIKPLREFLDRALLRLSCGKFGYNQSNWHDTERALRVIVAAKDVTFLPRINQLISLLNKGTIFPWPDDFDEFGIARHLGVLHYARKKLEEAKKKQGRTN